MHHVVNSVYLHERPLYLDHVYSSEATAIQTPNSKPKENWKTEKERKTFYFNDLETYTAFTLNGFDGQKRNLTFAKTDFQVSKLKFQSCNFT